MQYKLMLQAKKGGMTMTKYLLKMKSTIDALASTDNKLFEKDQILHILGGLCFEYDTFIISLTLHWKQPKL